ncbi:histidine kinase [Curtobacterium sp. PhB136]|uniref:sensor histidine kinase n=1 Tax=Curtobacterium sp. PhB136 TaxID=2485181 RepID=UPI00104F10D2|nr:histidine kinase [Curtobacterium sp. PhB136]
MNDEPQRPEIESPRWLRAQRAVPRSMPYISVTAMLVEIATAIILGGSFLGYMGAVVCAVGAVAARRRPYVGIGAVLLGTALATLGHRDALAEFTVVAFTLFAITATGTPAFRSTLLSAGVVAGIVAASGYLDHGRVVQWDGAAGVLSVVAAGAIGSALFQQYRSWEALRARAEDAIVTRDIEATRRVAEERIRIARDLHDIIGHQTAVVNMHLGAIAVSGLATDSRTAASVEAAQTATQRILAETQHTLRVLRADEHAAAASSPLPTLQDMAALVRSFSEIGLNVDAQIPTPLPKTSDAVGVTVYRVVQEALTNAHRYGAGEAALTLHAAAGALHVEVTNPTRPDASNVHGTGFGIMGMQERVKSVEGTVRIDVEDDVFAVFVTIPEEQA